MDLPSQQAVDPNPARVCRRARECVVRCRPTPPSSPPRQTARARASPPQGRLHTTDSPRAFASIITTRVRPVGHRRPRLPSIQDSPAPQPAVSLGILCPHFNHRRPRRRLVVGLAVLCIELVDNTRNAIFVLCVLRATALFFLCCDDSVSYQSSPLSLEPLVLPSFGLASQRQS